MSGLTYRYYREQIKHSRFTSFMLASDLAGLRRMLFVVWLFLCAWLAWHLPPGGCS